MKFFYIILTLALYIARGDAIGKVHPYAKADGPLAAIVLRNIPISASVVRPTDMSRAIDEAENAYQSALSLVEDAVSKGGHLAPEPSAEAEAILFKGYSIMSSAQNKVSAMYVGGTSLPASAIDQAKSIIAQAEGEVASDFIKMASYLRTGVVYNTPLVGKQQTASRRISGPTGMSSMTTKMSMSATTTTAGIGALTTSSRSTSHTSIRVSTSSGTSSEEKVPTTTRSATGSEAKSGGQTTGIEIAAIAIPAVLLSFFVGI
jgi:hypothetical protein